MTTPIITNLASKKMIGKSIRMTLTENKTFKLWKGFKKESKLITNAVTTDLYSLQEYDALLNYHTFTPTTTFTKWALAEVSDFDSVPEGFKPFTLNGGLYAVFNLVGTIPQFIALNNYIFTEWLPNSEYELDHREHFELLGDKYKRNDPTSEEQVWIPIKAK